MKAAFFFVLICCNFVVLGQREKTPYVILVSFDGFRYDYHQKFPTPNFTEFIAAGSHAEAMIPSFPSKTFPNHYSIVTGLYPGHHGLVDNSFYDPSRALYYAMSKKERVQDPYFYSGTPIWELASKANIGSASYFWVGTELPGNHPDYYYPYSEAVPDTARVDQVLAWLAMPEKERPHFISLYFSSPDKEGHDHGPLSEENVAAIQNADKLLGRLMKGVKGSNLDINVILVSDHGMKELRRVESTFIFLDEVFNVKDTTIHFSNGGTQAHIYVDDKSVTDSLHSEILKKSSHFRVLKQSQFPEDWHYKNTRSGDLMIIADEGYYIRDGKREQFLKTLEIGTTFGVHGYDPKTVKDMYGIFYAAGPNIRQGVTLKPFENIHVYPLIARILQLPIPDIDGKFQVLKPVYKKAD